MRRVPCTVFKSKKVPEGQECWITSVVEVGDRMGFWLIWENGDGTKSRCKESLDTCEVWDRRITQKTTHADIYGLWQVDH